MPGVLGDLPLDSLRLHGPLPARRRNDLRNLENLEDRVVADAIACNLLKNRGVLHFQAVYSMWETYCGFFSQKLVKNTDKSSHEKIILNWKVTPLKLMESLILVLQRNLDRYWKCLKNRWVLSSCWRSFLPQDSSWGMKSERKKKSLITRYLKCYSNVQKIAPKLLLLSERFI